MVKVNPETIKLEMRPRIGSHDAERGINYPFAYSNEMDISASVVEANLINNIPVYSIVYQMPAYVWPEFLTHRDRERNAMSFRAVPSKNIIEQFATVLPRPWRKAARGMQPAGIIDDPSVITSADQIWEAVRQIAIMATTQLENLGIAKEQRNRLLMPFSYFKSIVTATEYSNFLKLREHETAQYEMQVVAMLTRVVIEAAKPEHSDIHMPFAYVHNHEDLNSTLAISTARCARVSYLNHDSTDPTFEKDLKLHDDLVIAEPQHSSPAGHQVIDPEFVYTHFDSKYSDLMLHYYRDKQHMFSGPFRDGVVQYRKLLELTG